MQFSPALSAALLAFGSLALAAPAAAEITFMQSTQATHERIVTYTPLAGSSLLEISGTELGGNPALAVGLALLKPAYGPPPAMLLPVDMLMSATSTAMVTDTGTQFEQGFFDGTLSYTWFDPGLAAVVNVLTVTFTGATLNVDYGGTPAGSFFATHPAQTVSYTSDVFDLMGAYEADFALAFSAITTAFAVDSGYGVEFSSNVAGTFAVGVPEPATWGTMIMGFGMIGFAARRRRVGKLVSA